MGTLRALVEAASANKNVQAFLQVLRACEGTSGRDGYRTLFGGRLFDSYADHPRQKIPFRDTYSTAAGAYQFLASTWDECKKVLDLPDFSPESQNRAAIYLIYRRGALEDVYAGRIAVAVADCNKEWASLPGSPYGQPVKSLAFCLQVYADNGGVLRAVDRPGGTPTSTPEQPAVAGPPIQKEGSRMDPLTAISIFGPIIAKLIPQVAPLFGDGAKQNVSAATTVLQTVVEAAQAVNEQEAVQKIQDDPALLKTVTEAVVTEPSIMAVLEIGGGIKAAREADVAATQAERPFYYSPAFVMSVILLPLVYWVVGAVLVGGVEVTPESSQFWKIFGTGFMPETRSATVNLVLGMVLGGVIGFYFGTTAGSQKKDDLLARKGQ